MKQPLIAVALCYGAGVILGHFVEAPLWPAFIVSFGLTAVALASAAVRPLALPLLLLVFGWLNLSSRTAVLSPDDLRLLIGGEPALVSVRGEIKGMPTERVSVQDDKESRRSLAELEVKELRVGRGKWQPAFGRVMSRTAGLLGSNVFAGQTIEVSGIALQPPPPVAEGVFDYATYLRQRGIHYELKVESEQDWRVTGRDHTPPLSQRFRAWGQRTLAYGLPHQDESLHLQWAMLLGWQTALTSEVSEPFMRSGTMHIFAISGLHIALIAGIFVALLRAMAVPRLVYGLAIIPILWGYTAATGWQASAIRSTIMMSVIIGGWSLKRPGDLLNSLAVAALIILVWQPEQLFQAGFQLSFFVVLSIALLSPPIDEWRKRYIKLDPMLPFDLRPRWQRWGAKLGGRVWQFFATSLAAFIGSMPLIAYYFNLFTPGSLLANMLVVPASGLALMSGLGALITGDFIPLATQLFNHSGWFWMRSMVFLSERTADLPMAWRHTRAPGVLYFALHYGLLLIASSGCWRHRLLRWLSIGSMLILLGGWLVAGQRMRTWHRVTTIPLSGGHAVLVEPRGADEWLIDCGNERAFEFTLKPFLKSKGLNSIEHFLLTHGDARQIGAASVLHENFPVRHALASALPARSSRYREVISELEGRSKLTRVATNSAELAPWQFLHPDVSDRFSNADDSAVVSTTSFDGVNVLVVSDLGRAGQNALFNRHPDLRADVVIAGLPGRGEPLESDWLESLQPRLIVIADSEIPHTRRATRELMQRLQRSGRQVIFTHQAGAVTLEIRDRVWRIRSARPLH